MKKYLIIVLVILISPFASKGGDEANSATNAIAEKTRWGKSLKIEENWQKLSPEEKYRRMREWRLKMEQGLIELRTKKIEGTISEEDAKRLEKMEQMLKKLDERLSCVTNTAKASEKPIDQSLTNKQKDTKNNENNK